MAETPETPDASTTPPISSAPSAPLSGPSGRSVFFALGLGTLVVAVVLGLILSHVGKPTSYGPAGWTTFHDPAGYFTIALPPGWTIDGGQNGTGTTGDSSGSYTVTNYEWVASDPTTGSAGPSVYISYHALPTAFARQFECKNLSAANTTVDGLPASTISGPGWLLSTAAAHYQVNYGFPSSKLELPKPPTPIPAATATAGQDLANQVAATFRPTPATPLSC